MLIVMTLIALATVYLARDCAKDFHREGMSRVRGRL